MSKTADILLKLPSYIFHPYWVPTYGITLFALTCLQLTSSAYIATLIIATFVTTGLIPLIMALFCLRNMDDSLEMADRQSRTVPYIYTFFSYALWAYFLYKVLHAPIVIMCIAISATMLIGIILSVNLSWKISAHMTCFGGLTGGILALGKFMNYMPIITISIAFILAIFLSISRTYMKAHTSEQLIVGYLLGISCTYFSTLWL